MHCASCEMLIEKEIKKGMPGVRVKASCNSGKLEIENNIIDDSLVEKLVANCSYEVVKVNNRKNRFTFKDFSELLLASSIVFLLFVFLSRFELLKLFPDLSSDISLFIALMVGLVASLSTCLAITGGLVISFSAIGGEKDTFFKKSIPQIYFHIGRIVSFFLLGGILGSLGSFVQYSSLFTGILTIIISVVMFYIALNILGLSSTKFYLPKIIGEKISSIKTSKRPFFIGLLGALSFFLPCGFTQSMQILAVASGSFLSGSLIMLFFALGTLPVLFSVGVGSSYVNNKKFGIFNKFIVVIIILFSFYSINNGLSLLGFKYSFNIFKGQSLTSSIESDYQVVQLDIDYTFVQKEFRIKKGIPVKFIINAIRVTGCSDEVIISQLGLSTGKMKNGNKYTLEFIPEKEGIIPFSCWMGMINGRFIVE